MSIRIISGEFKGRKLQSIPGKKVRPTSDRTREAIFNILAHDVEGAFVLDLFAGTGAFGIEALSRGAEYAVFVDIDKDAIRALRSNVQGMPVAHRTKVIQWDLTKNLNCLCSPQYRFNLVFMDPPYSKNMITPPLLHLLESHSLEPGACLIIEHSALEPIPEIKMPLKLNDQRRYGKTLVSFLNYVL